MNISHIEHIGIAVNSIDEAIPYYEHAWAKMLRCRRSSRPKSKNRLFYGGRHQNRITRINRSGRTYRKIYREKGPGVHHLAFAVDNVNDSLAELEEKGVRLIDQKARKGAEGLNIGFLHPKSTMGVLTEICGKE